jgi:hypothetical protein
MTTIYYYDKDTQELLGEGVARICPVTKTDLIIPAYATIVEPPPENEGFAVIFNGIAWEYAVDKRETVFYNEQGEEFIQASLGELPEWALLEPPEHEPEEEPEPEPEKTLEELKLEAVQKAKQDAYGNLLKTDWYIIRMTDTGAEVPQDVVNERAAIRLACDNKVAAIGNATTIEELKAIGV